MSADEACMLNKGAPLTNEFIELFLQQRSGFFFVEFTMYTYLYLHLLFLMHLCIYIHLFMPLFIYHHEKQLNAWMFLVLAMHILFTCMQIFIHTHEYI